MDKAWLPFLLMVGQQGEMVLSLSSFAPEKLVSRDGFGRPVLRQSAHSSHSG